MRLCYLCQDYVGITDVVKHLFYLGDTNLDLAITVQLICLLFGIYCNRALLSNFVG